jgi:hypothetical protein
MEAIRAKASMTAWGQYAFWSHDSLGQRRHGHQIAMEALAPDPHRTPTHTPTQKAACD